ncbi:ANL_collapsed_G0042180.mRNA.1.CDS.1 [Saccharomyces cerevisiae]|nr:ANL_collapsed_G0042180.mRNA.1.CDS.1 [Saccharomyces cerevisiae]
MKFILIIIGSCQLAVSFNKNYCQIKTLTRASILDTELSEVDETFGTESDFDLSCAVCKVNERNTVLWPCRCYAIARIAEFLWVYVGSALAYVVGVKFMGTVRFILFQIVNNSLRTFAWYLKKRFFVWEL